MVSIQKEEHGGLSLLLEEEQERATGGVVGNGIGQEEDSKGYDGKQQTKGKDSITPLPLQQLLDANGIILSSSITATKITRSLEDFVW